MANEPRIAPVSADTVQGEVKALVEGQRKMWGKPLLPYLLYARSPAIFKGANAMWATVLSFKKIDPGLKVLVNRRVAWWNGCPF